MLTVAVGRKHEPLLYVRWNSSKLIRSITLDSLCQDGVRRSEVVQGCHSLFRMIRFTAAGASKSSAFDSSINSSTLTRLEPLSILRIVR